MYLFVVVRSVDLGKDIFGGESLADFLTIIRRMAGIVEFHSARDDVGVDSVMDNEGFGDSGDDDSSSEDKMASDRITRGIVISWPISIIVLGMFFLYVVLNTWEITVCSIDEVGVRQLLSLLLSSMWL